MLNLDTHILLRSLTGEISRREQEILSGDQWSISAIVLWEIAELAQLKRIEIDLASPDLTRILAQIHVWPVNIDICRAIAALDFASDPADELIAATSIVHRLPW